MRESGGESGVSNTHIQAHIHTFTHIYTSFTHFSLGVQKLPPFTGTIAYKAPEARGNNRSVMPLDAFYWAARVLQWREQYVDANSEMKRQPCEAPSWLGSSLATIGRELGMPRKHVLVTAC